MRQRIIVKKGLCGSSDYQKIQVKNSSLKRSHERFVKSPEYIMIQEIEVKQQPLTLETILRTKTKVWFFGGWRFISKLDRQSLEILLADPKTKWM